MVPLMEDTFPSLITYKGMQKLAYKFAEKLNEDTVKFVKKVDNYRKMYKKPKDVIYHTMITNCFDDPASEMVNENYDAAGCDYDSLIDCLYKQFNGISKLKL